MFNLVIAKVFFFQKTRSNHGKPRITKMDRFGYFFSKPKSWIINCNKDIKTNLEATEMWV